MKNQESPFVGQIVNGPSKFDLMNALFSGSTAAQTHLPVDFWVIAPILSHRPLHWPVRVTSVSREDGSGESWIVKGFIVLKPGPKCQRETVHVSIYFNTKDRKGSFRQPTDT